MMKKTRYYFLEQYDDYLKDPSKDYIIDEFYDEDYLEIEEHCDDIEWKKEFINNKMISHFNNGGEFYKIIKQDLTELEEANIDDTMKLMINDYKYIRKYVLNHKNITD